MNTYPNYQVITHFCDNDLYKFSMCFAVLKNFPRTIVKYRFVDRNDTIYPPHFAQELQHQLKLLEDVVITDEEISYMQKKMYYMPNWFYTFLKGYRYDSSEVSVQQDEEGHLSVDIEGYWYKTIFWEIPILSIISEMLHFYKGDIDRYDALTEYNKAIDKAERLCSNGCRYALFGTRRRFSFAHEDLVTKASVEVNDDGFDGRCTGTSNVYFAMKYNLPIIGTMAHEFVCAIAAMYGVVEANHIAMQKWQDTYDGALGIFLYDTYTWKAFDNNFSEHFVRCFSGLRIDSGDNIEQYNKIIKKYEELNVPIIGKQIIFSNALKVQDAIDLQQQLGDKKASISFGIGTNLSCDVNGAEPSNIVIKLVAAKITEKREFNDTCKISEDKGKITGNSEIVNVFKKTLHIK